MSTSGLVCMVLNPRLEGVTELQGLVRISRLVSFRLFWENPDFESVAVSTKPRNDSSFKFIFFLD